MKRRKKSARPQTANLPTNDVAKELLEPILRFLSVSGMSQSSARKEFELAWQLVASARSSVRVNHLASIAAYGELVGAWMRHPDFLDTHGNPRDLPMTGLKGFKALVKTVDGSLSPEIAISVLQTYGNVTRLKNTRYRLLKPFFHVNNKYAVAFEPSARFLADASATVNCLLNPSSKNDAPKLFWRVADTPDLPEESINSYLDFARRRSLVFLQEIDDWLQTHSKSTLKSRRTGRAGLGIFSICDGPIE